MKKTIESQVSKRRLTGTSTTGRTLKVVLENSNRLLVKVTAGTIIMFVIFLLVGIPIIIGGLTYMSVKAFTGVSIVIFGLFISVVPILATKTKKHVFDKSTGMYHRGKKEIKLNDIHAIQMIKKIGGSVSRKYYCYEINLVLNNTKRIHLTVIGERNEPHKDARILSDFIGVPIWDKK
jgi:hypothetical protein